MDRVLAILSSVASIAVPAACIQSPPPVGIEQQAPLHTGGPFPALDGVEWIRAPAVDAAAGLDAPVELSGRVRLVEFGRTGCAGCRKMAPELERLAERYGPRGLELVHLLDGRADDPAAAASAAAELPGALGRDPDGRFFDRMQVAATPTFAVLTPDATIVFWQATTRPELLDEWLAEAFARATTGRGPESR